MRQIAALWILVAAWAPMASAEGKRFTGPWDLPALQKPPKVEWQDAKGEMRRLLYEGEPYKGKPTRVFAYCAFPEKSDRKLPAMVLVHGGGGQAYKEWAKLWADRGYVALAMDLAGHGPNKKRLDDGGPDQGHAEKFPPEAIDLADVWTYHAIAAVVRGTSLLASLPEVDAERIGVTGISWGGYLTCIAAGLDPRLKVAVPVYGCGFIHENSAWPKQFAAMPEDWRKKWIANFEPSVYLGQAEMPVLFVNGTNDFAYPLDSYQKSYRLVKNARLCVTVKMPHSHVAGWAPVEIGLFVDSVLAGGKPLPRFEDVKVDEEANVLNARVKSPVKLVSAELHWTEDDGPWLERKWKTKTVAIDEGAISAKLPDGKRLVFFLTVKDEREALVSTPHHTRGSD